MYTVYILRCADGTLYTGMTNHLARRVAQHNEGRSAGAKYTRSRRPVHLVYWEEAPDQSSALRREAAIKGLTRAQKLRLIEEGSPSMKPYVPAPIDTSGIQLSDDLLDLTEKLAQNVHENWSKGRLDEGWTYGPVRDGTTKTTPCLVPYADLPESERDYDRRTALETVRTILSLGYTIRKEGE